MIRTAPVLIPPQLLPTSVLQWSVVAATGGAAGWATPIVWAMTVAALVAFSVWRMERLEL